jgi:hypothetical protein
MTNPRLAYAVYDARRTISQRMSVAGELVMSLGCISENSWFYAAIGREVHLDGPTGRVEPDNVIGGV